jgi:glycosyltransferase involved in cell wall biosynthesis
VLRAFAALHPVPGGWKLVIVDNNSEDGTSSVLAEFADRLPLLTLRERRAGKSRALNRAIPALEGDLVVATDDDVLPDPGWLAALRHAADTHPEATMFGGPVLPHWSRPPPSWLLKPPASCPCCTR